MASMKIVIVDDDPDIRETLKCILETRKYMAITASNKAQGLETIRAEKPNLAVLDVMMEAKDDGFEMARELKQDAEFKDMPILMLTGVKQETGIDFKSTAGDPTWNPVDSFLDKPVKPAAFIAEVEKLLAK